MEVGFIAQAFQGEDWDAEKSPGSSLKDSLPGTEGLESLEEAERFNLYYLNQHQPGTPIQAGTPDTFLIRETLWHTIRCFLLPALCVSCHVGIPAFPLSSLGFGFCKGLLKEKSDFLSFPILHI